MYIINLKESITSPASQVLDFMGVTSSSAKLAHNLLQKTSLEHFWEYWLRLLVDFVQYHIGNMTILFYFGQREKKMFDYKRKPTSLTFILKKFL